MKIILLAFVTAIIGITLLACGKSSNSTPSGNSQPTPGGSPPGKMDPMTTAKLNFEENCGLCHKVDGTGGKITVKGEKLNVPNLGAGHALHHTDAEFEDQIADGGDGMPQFKDKLTKEQIHDIVLYIRKAFQAGAAK